MDAAVPDTRHPAPDTRALLVLWLLSGVLWLAFLGGPDVSRTQEARVLETAREMLGGLFHLAAAATALGFMSKPGAIGYPILFALALATIERRWRWLARLLLSGAPFTLALIALPWYAAAVRERGWQTFLKELHDTAGGR